MPERNISGIMRLLELSDSALPVGSFSFSCGLETAAAEGVVGNAEELELFTRDAVRQAATCDAVASLAAHRAHRAGDYSLLIEADRQVILCKLNAESRAMTLRMGKKLTQLAALLTASPIIRRWSHDVEHGATHGTFPVSQALLFAESGIGEEELFAAHLYGVANTILSAALRCMKVSHIDTQRILFRLSDFAYPLYKHSRVMTLDQMNAFAPQTDQLASMHEKGIRRMFMN